MTTGSDRGGRRRGTANRDARGPQITPWSLAGGVVARALEAHVHVVVVVRLVAHQALARAAAVRVLEDALEPPLAHAVFPGPVVEDALDLEVEEDHLDAAIFAGGREEALEQLEGCGAVEVVPVGVDEVRRVLGGLLLVDEPDVDVAAGLVRPVLGDAAAGLGGDVADRQDVRVGERLARVADRALDELDRRRGAERAPGAADEIAVAWWQLRLRRVLCSV